MLTVRAFPKFGLLRNADRGRAMVRTVLHIQSSMTHCLNHEQHLAAYYGVRLFIHGRRA